MEKEQQKHNHHRIVPVALIALGVPIALTVGFLLVANIMFHDEKPPDDSALRLPDIALNETQNAYIDIQHMDAAVLSIDPAHEKPIQDNLIDQMLNGSTWDEARLKEVFSTYSPAMVEFHQAAKKELYQNPSEAKPSTWTVNDLPKTYSDIRFVGKLVSVEALQKAKNGDVAGGLAEAMEVVKLGQMMESGQETLIEWLVASSVKQIGLGAVRQISLQATVSAELSRTIVTQLEQYRDSTPGLVSAMKFENTGYDRYQAQLQHVDTMLGLYNISVDAATGQATSGSVGGLPMILDRMGILRFYYWPNQNHRFIIESREKMVALAQANCATGNLNPALIRYSHRTGLGRLIEPNAIGKMFADIGQVSYSGAREKSCNESVAVSATQATLAISAYQHDNGRLPPMLNDLVPKYLTGVPLDPYSNKPLIYDAAQKIVYSVGQDRKDDHGNTKRMTDYTNPGQEWQNMFDPTFVVSQ